MWFDNASDVTADNASDETAEHKLLKKLLTDDFDLGWAKQGNF